MGVIYRKIRFKLEGKILIIFEHLNMNFKLTITFILNILLIVSIYPIVG